MQRLIHLDHVAILVSSLGEYVQHAKKSSWPVGMIQTFESEGTREVYVGPDDAVRLLFLEAIGDGPYKHAFEKRGPGLHHLGFNTQNIETFLETLSGTGWYLHPKSIATFRQSKTVWLTNKGQPFLVEVHETNRQPKDWLDLVAPGDLEKNLPFGLTTGDFDVSVAGLSICVIQ